MQCLNCKCYKMDVRVLTVLMSLLIRLLLIVSSSYSIRFIACCGCWLIWCMGFFNSDYEIRFSLSDCLFTVRWNKRFFLPLDKKICRDFNIAYTVYGHISFIEFSDDTHLTNSKRKS